MHQLRGLRGQGLRVKRQEFNGTDYTILPPPVRTPGHRLGPHRSTLCPQPSAPLNPPPSTPLNPLHSHLAEISRIEKILRAKSPERHPMIQLDDSGASAEPRHVPVLLS